MGTMDDVKMLQQEGKSVDEIKSFLAQRGISGEEASRYISQANIKDAVVSGVPSPSENVGFPLTQDGYQIAGGQNYEEMQPSMLPPQQETQEIGEPQYSGEYAGYQQQQDYYGQTYGQYQPYQESLSSDVISEIAEQVVSEKLSLLNEKLEKAIDFKTTAEARITSLSERLIRIEQILDKLQIALLHKVGEYVQDVADMKKELVETQKSFKVVSHGHHSHSQHSSGGQHAGHETSHSGHSHQHHSAHGGKHRP